MGQKKTTFLETYLTTYYSMICIMNTNFFNHFEIVRGKLLIGFEMVIASEDKSNTADSYKSQLSDYF